MRPIGGGFDPYHDVTRPPRRSLPPVGVPPLSPARPAAGAGDAAPADVELSVRVLADGGSITVRRRVVVGPDGARHTVGIDAIVR